VELRNLRFEIDMRDGAAPPFFAVSARGLDLLKIVDCQFECAGGAPANAGAVHFEARNSAQPSVAILEGCCFTGAAIAVEMINRGLIKAEQCGFGPHTAVFRLRDEAVRPASDDPLVELSRCTTLMDDGAVFQIEKTVSGTL